MTKLDILFTYSNRRIRDSWVAMGKSEITENTRIFNEGIIYKLNVFLDPGKDKDSQPAKLIFCNKSLTSKTPLDWENLKIIDHSLGELSFGNNIISPNFVMLIDEYEYEDVYKNFPVDNNFIPFLDELDDITGQVNISDDDYQLCIRCLGAPFITDDELEYTRKEITDLAIKPALERYFKYFPKTEIVTEPITGTEQLLEFPTDAYDVIHFSVQQRGASGAGMITNPLLRYWDEGMYSGGFGASINGNYHGTYSPKTQTNTFESMALGRAAQQAVVNYRTRYHLDKIQKFVLPEGMEDTPENRKKYGEKKWFLRFFSNKGGIAEIHFAMHTLDFNDVEFARRPELIKLCNAEIKKLFGNLRRQVKSNIPGIVDYGNWVTEANEEIKEVEENWKAIVKYSSIIRGSL